MGTSLSNKPGHMAKGVCRIRCNCKTWCFSGCLFYYYDTIFSSKTVYLKVSGKIGSLSELKTPVKICLFLDNQRGKNGPASSRFRILKFTEWYTEM
jgi:hypothetical protein